MPQNGPMNMEDELSDVPNVQGREVDAEKDEVVNRKSEAKPMDQHMAQILEYVPDTLKERVSQMKREDIAMPGVPRDREAYEAYLAAEKMIRDVRRRQEKQNFNWNGLPKQNG